MPTDVDNRQQESGEKVTPMPAGAPCYTVPGKEPDDDPVPISNFRLELLATYDLPDGSRIYRVRTETARGVSPPFELDGYILATRTRLNTVLGRFSRARWWGSDPQMSTMIDHLDCQEQFKPRAARVEHYGRSTVGKATTWVFGNVAIRAGESVSPDENGIYQFDDDTAVSLAPWCADDDGGVPRAPVLEDTPVGVSEDGALACVELVDRAWGNAGLLALGWAWAVQYRGECMRQLRLFPYLYLHGATGGGKTSLAHAIGAMWYGRTDIPEVDLAERGVPSMGTVKGFERTMASEVIALVDEAGPGKVKHAVDMLKRMATGAAGRRARRNDRADTRLIVPRAGVMLTSNGRVQGEEAFMRRCCVVQMPKLGKDARSRDAHRRQLLGRGHELSGFVRVHLERVTSGLNPQDVWCVPGHVFIEAVRINTRKLGDTSGSDQVALAYSIAETGLHNLLLTLRALDNSLEGEGHFNRERMADFHRWVERLVGSESAGRGESSLPAQLFDDVCHKGKMTRHAQAITPFCWMRDAVISPDDEMIGGTVFLALAPIGSALFEIPSSKWTQHTWPALLDELAALPYLARKNQRCRPPARGGVSMSAQRGVWSFNITKGSPQQLVSLAEWLYLSGAVA